GEGLHTRGRHQKETGGRGCCKQLVPCSQRRGVTKQLHQEEKDCAHEGVTKWKREVVGVVTKTTSMLPKQFLKKLYVRSPIYFVFTKGIFDLRNAVTTG
ncbi:9313_t:CDS:1, partial [Funneliformis geosporum]